MERLMCSALLLVFIAAVTEAASWNYSPTSDYGPHNWGKKFPEYCDPNSYPRQSPIDIKKGLLVFDSSLQKMRHENFDTKNVLFQAQNNGHTVQFNVDGDVETEGGPVDNVHYYALQLHFHWGDSNPMDGHGSEHTILGQQHKAEMHIVNVNHKHDKLDISEVIKKDDGLLVLGVFIDVVDKSKNQMPNEEFAKIIEGAEMVKDRAGSKYNMSRGYINLEKLMPMNPEHYYTYPGGLTTPSCHGAVTWVVYKNPIYITQEQLSVFYTVKDEDGKNLTNIFRPPQSVNDRVVKTTNPEDGNANGASNNVQVTLALVFFAFLLSLFL
ncbi:carbonic anhydrase 2-like [Lineus longissimus]|uniref:carbonic anhydrase 2-like n=1 Tax=Lineus longissimus TaxID=88925 RepID=UPI002B4E6215